MSTSSVEHPLSPVRLKTGIVVEPIIPIGVLTPTGFRLFDFLVDSGADFTVLPFSLAKQIGISLKGCKTSQTLGVEGQGTKIYHSKICIKIGHWEENIRCAFASHDRIPPLLGRLDLFEKYIITFHGKRQSLIFKRINLGKK